MLLILAASACAVWAVILLLPWRPWSTRERLPRASRDRDLSEVTVLIPARNEADVIERTLTALGQQGPGLSIVVVDDCSTDGTGARARQVQLAEAAIIVVNGAPRPPGWAGKPWALQQGRPHVTTPYVLLLDADIRLGAGVVLDLLDHLTERRLGLVSVMARLPTSGIWERLLVPAYVFFFKLLYPFARVNRPDTPLAAAAGGCMLLQVAALDRAGGFKAIAAELIDDCALAARVKGAGSPIWLCLSPAVVSQRGYRRLTDFWQMVARSAFTELDYSVTRLLVCTGLMGLAFVVPMAALFGLGYSAAVGAVALLLMMATYMPMVRFYNLPVLWATTLPVVAMLFLAMTWSSAWSYWRGTRALWKNRAYGVVE